MTFSSPSLGDPGIWTLESRLQFETSPANLTARLIDVTPEEVDKALQDSVREALAFLGAEGGGIGLFSEDGRSCHYKYGYFGEGASDIHFQTDMAQALPWWTSEQRAGRAVVIRRSPEDIPPEAAAEHSTAAAIGLKSNIGLPLIAGGGGAGRVWSEPPRGYCDYTPELLSRLEALVSVYTNVLYRLRARARLQRV